MQIDALGPAWGRTEVEEECVVDLLGLGASEADHQFALCRSYAAREGYEVIAAYHDAEKSGASVFWRDGLQDMLISAYARRYDAIIVEALGRLSREMEDMAGIHKRLTFADTKILVVHDGGEASTAMVGMRAVVAQMFREDGAKKVRRGMAGLISNGKSAGGGHTDIARIHAKQDGWKLSRPKRPS
jgi:hypothetical protein